MLLRLTRLLAAGKYFLQTHLLFLSQLPQHQLRSQVVQSPQPNPHLNLPVKKAKHLKRNDDDANARKQATLPKEQRSLLL
jgi:hypothetical protein